MSKEAYRRLRIQEDASQKTAKLTEYAAEFSEYSKRASIT
jgi:hypothetical protein